MLESILRVLVPSWRFFDRTGTRFILRIRNRNNDWQVAVPRWKATWYSFIFNPQGNLQLAFLSALERFVGEGQEAKSASEFEASKTFALVRNIAKRGQTAEFQFQILARTGATAEEEVYTSAWMANP